MPKNILIFSDGTGQAGGLMPDEKRTNVYKLYRATRCNPDTDIDPNEQLTFYDPGLGSKADGGKINIGWWRRIHNIVSQATGLGITRNIIDCYAAILQMYEPGDRIFLFGFSRGAYTVRCLGGVLGLCGVPMQTADGKPIKRDLKSTRDLAEKAVKKVYQHGSGQAAPRFKEQRLLLAKRFRKDHGSGSDKAANVVPYFIGVWDSVASVGLQWPILIGLAIFAIVAVFVLAGASWWLLSFVVTLPSFQSWFIAVFVLAAFGISAAMLSAQLRYATGIGVPFWESVHRTSWRMRFYDTSLNPAVRFAKHALAIDENRKDFERVAWSDFGRRSNDDAWFEQIWFAGNHSDIGGSYPETESRLSDVTLSWMVDKATEPPHGVKVDRSFLNLSPSSNGPQHDERKSSSLPWEEGIRTIPNDAPLHPTVIERFKLDQVLQYDEVTAYRPINLKNHKDVRKFYR